jgi:hypothetical protein
MILLKIYQVLSAVTTRSTGDSERMLYDGSELTRSTGDSERMLYDGSELTRDHLAQMTEDDDILYSYESYQHPVFESRS